MGTPWTQKATYSPATRRRALTSGKERLVMVRAQTQVLSLRPAPLEAGKPGLSASSQLQLLSESPTHRKLPFQTEEPLQASSSARSPTVGNSSVAYSRICLRTGRSRERRSEQRPQRGTWLAGLRTPLHNPCPPQLPTPPTIQKGQPPACSPVLNQRSSPLGV